MAIPFIPAIGAFFTGKSKKLFIIVAIIAALGFAFWHFRDSIRDAAYDQIFRQQVEERLEQERAEMDRLRRIIDEQNQAIEDFRQEIDAIREQSRELDRQIESQPEEEVLDFTIDEIMRLHQRTREAPERPQDGSEYQSEGEDTGSSGNASIDQFRGTEE